MTEKRETDSTALDPKLMEILACPACKGPVTQEGDRIVCGGCGKRYPIRDGIPIMLIDEAEDPVS
ncbi:MAG: Trm112 family protein [Armatimonadetes bacterium]|nr:Trm112 family protein [Armatimonadota bacterium]